MSNSVYIVAAKRTPVGKFQGALKTIPATKLGSLAIQAAIAQSGLNVTDIDECIMGHVLTAGAGQAPARQAMLGAGVPNHARALTVGKVCGSGLKAVTLGASAILLNHANVVVCGGQENMSRAPYLLQTARDGFRMGNKECTDSMILDGLWILTINCIWVTVQKHAQLNLKFLVKRKMLLRAIVTKKHNMLSKQMRFRSKLCLCLCHQRQNREMIVSNKLM